MTLLANVVLSLCLTALRSYNCPPMSHLGTVGGSVHGSVGMVTERITASTAALGRAFSFSDASCSYTRVPMPSVAVAVGITEADRFVCRRSVAVLAPGAPWTSVFPVALAPPWGRSLSLPPPPIALCSFSCPPMLLVGAVGGPVRGSVSTMAAELTAVLAALACALVLSDAYRSWTRLLMPSPAVAVGMTEADGFVCRR